MDYRKIKASEIDALWELQKRYKAEIGEEEPGEDARDRFAEAIEKGMILFFGVWQENALIASCSVTVGFSTFDYKPSGVSSLTVGCADCDVNMYQSLGFSIPLGKLLAFDGAR